MSNTTSTTASHLTFKKIGMGVYQSNAVNSANLVVSYRIQQTPGEWVLAHTSESGCPNKFLGSFKLLRDAKQAAQDDAGNGTCGNCGDDMGEGHDGIALELCEDCFDDAGVENEHNDEHDTHHDDCPLCEMKSETGKTSAVETCECGEWPVEEYGAQCPSCPASVARAEAEEVSDMEDDSCETCGALSDIRLPGCEDCREDFCAACDGGSGADCEMGCKVEMELHPEMPAPVVEAAPLKPGQRWRDAEEWVETKGLSQEQSWAIQRICDELRMSEKNLIRATKDIADRSARFAAELLETGSVHSAPCAYREYSELSEVIAVHKAKVDFLFNLVYAMMGSDALTELRAVIEPAKAVKAVA